ncbi:hypothetical protein RhiJN_24453 [Ceratobasidium sp. AG-Ba]|nr:hypothetical protein RhiJN_24453 [Ceratobasidium sp. AG-Ba]
MPGSPTSKTTTQSRLRIQEIKLEPDRSKYDIEIEIQLDNKTLHKLNTIKKGRKLCWPDLRTPCDVYKNAEVIILVTEVHVLKRNRVFKAKFNASESICRGTMKIVCDNTSRTVEISFADAKTAERAYIEALEKVQGTPRQPGLIERAGKIGDAFSALLALSSTMAKLDPTGGTKMVFSSCTTALQRFKEQGKRDVVLGALVDGLAGLRPSIESASGVAGETLQDTVLKILDLTEDVSVFVLNSRPQDWLGTLRDAYSTAAEDQTALFVNRFENLRKDSELERIRARLRELKPAQLASFDEGKQCLAGTRTEIIARLESWAESMEKPSLVWMYGLAGLGKSSIATSVAKRLHDMGLLAASFFCKRDSPELRDPRKVLLTIVYRLAQVWDSYARALVKIIQEGISLDLEHLPHLYNALVTVPLQNTTAQEKPPKAFVVIVDALDECGEVATRGQLLTYLIEISRVVPGVRVLVTSRPDHDIRASFNGIASNSFEEIDVHEYDASLDIRSFTRERLYTIGMIDEPVGTVAGIISELAAGSFIWARTACAYILSGVDPSRRWKLLTHGGRLNDIDELYEAILTSKETMVDEENTQDMLACLGPIIATSIHSPLPIYSLARLLSNNPSRAAFQGTLRMLSSLLYTDDRLGGAVRVLHPSFMDYITNPSRSKTLCINLDEQNQRLAECCLQTMLSSLRFNMTGLGTSHYWNTEAVGAENRTSMGIEPHLAYSCVYWASHVSQVPIDNLYEDLRAFLFGIQPLYWLETLSVLGKLGVAPPSLSRITEHCTTIRALFYDAISQSPPHLYITALALSPSNSGASKRMRAWFPNILRVAEGVEDEWSPCVRAITAPAGVNSVSLLPNGKTIVAGLKNGMIQTWDAATGDAVLAPFQGHARSVTCVAVSPDGHHIVSSSEDMTLRVWDAETGAVTLGPLSGHTGEVQNVAYSPDGRKIASGSADKTVRIWDAITGKSVTDPLSGHSNWVRVLSSSDDGTLRLWGLRNGTPVLEPLEGHTRWVQSAVFSPDGLKVASGSTDQTVRLWSSETGKQLINPLTGHSGSVMSVAFSSDGDQIVSGSTDGTVRIWNAHSGALMLGPFTGHSASINSIAISTDCRWLVSGSNDKTIRIWDTTLAPSATATDTPSASLPGHSDSITSVAFSPDSRFVVSGSDDKTVRIWDIDTGRMMLGPLEGHSARVNSVAYSPDGSRVASSSRNSNVRIWDAKTGTLAVEPLQGHSGSVLVVTFSPNGTLIASGSVDGTVRIWDASTYEPVIALAGHSYLVQCIAFSPDSMRIVSGTYDATIRVWDANTGSTVTGPMEGQPGWLLCLAFSPEGHHIASGSDDGTIRIWDTQTGHQVLDPLRGHSDWVNCVTYSHDGQRIISCSNDGTIRVWDAKTGQPVLEPLRGHSDSVKSVAVSSDGRYIVSGSEDKTIRFWDAIPYLNPSPHPVRYLPGTHIRTLHTEDRMLVTSAELARHLDLNRPGWVTTADGKPLLWLPPELRKVDDSLMCISHTGVRRRVVMDFSRFVHGEDWTMVIAE